MMEFSLSHWVIFGIVALVLFRKRLPPLIRSLRDSLAAYAEQAAERRRRQKAQPPRIELVTEQRDPSMTKHLKKFLWSPAFWATLGLVGCTTGLYFQRVAANGSGLWCLGLIFLGAAYLERKDV
jgi:Sec-independent protein translocase protein TatA